MEDAGTSLWSVLIGLFVLTIVFGLSVLVAKDSNKNQIGFISNQCQPYDAIVWFFVTLSICGVGFLYYLHRRSVVLHGQGKAESANPVPGDSLEYLWKLKEKGVISEAEWEQKKRKILDL